MRVFRRRFHLQTRILVSFLAVLVGAVALVVTVVDLRKEHLLLELSRERGLAIAHSLEAAAAGSLLSYNYVALQQLADRATEEGGVGYVIITDKEGRVAGYSGRPEWQGQHLTDAASDAAGRSRKTLVQRVDHPALGPDPGFDVAVPVYVEGSPRKWGTVRVGLSLTPMYAEQRNTRLAILGLGLAVLGLAALIARELARRITGPIARLVEGTEELARGNFDHRVGLRTGDEIEQLSTRFDAMASRIRDQRAEVEGKNRELALLNASLESMVAERTRALAEAEEKYRLLVDHSPNAICIVQEGRLRFFNRALVEIFGHGEAALADPAFDPAVLVDESRRDTFRRLISDPRAEETDEGLEEIAGVRADGARVVLDVRRTWISYRGAPACEMILIDVTEQRRLRDQAMSGERLRALGEMASGVAHDFNNLLGTILARAQFLQHRTDDPELARGLAIIEKAAVDGGETVRRIQDFSRVRKDRDFSRVDLDTVVEDILEMTRSAWEDDARRKGKRIEVQRDLGGPAAVDGNVHELREVFMNLVLNAVDAIEGEGRLLVTTRVDEDGVRVSLADSGAGMSTEVRRRLFDPFFSTKGVEGTGLGMSIVYGIVTRHGGTIDVESEPGEGTVFHLAFPHATGTGEDPQAGFDPARLTGTGHVLVVDDEPGIRDLLADILEGAGYTVTRAADGEAAVALLADFAPDLVLTDLGMPGLTGWDVSLEVGKRHPGTPVLLLTGWGAALDPEETARHGVSRTLQKPFTMNGILEAVADLLDDDAGRRAA